MAQVRGPSLAELDRAGRAFAARVRAQLREALIEGARALGVTPSADDLARVRSAWDGRVDGLLVDVADAYWAGVDRVHGRVARLVAARAGQLVAAGPAPSTDLPVEADVVPRVSSVVADLHLAAARNRLVGVGDVVWEHARAELLTGMRAGETTAQLRDRVVMSTGLAAPRAEAIARTEVNGAMNLGALDEMSTISPDSTKTWLATAGPRTRPAHAKVDGQTVKVRDKFDVSGVAMTGPHDPTAPGELSINCRCTTLYEISDEVVDGLADEAFHLSGRHDQADHAGDDGPDQPELVGSWATLSEPLSDAEVYAVERYTKADFQKLNSKLRTGRELDVHNQRVRDGLDGALDKSVLHRDANVLRVANGAWLRRLKVGGSFQDNGFVSTTANQEFDKGFGAALLRIRVPAGSHGVYVPQAYTDALGNEDELILPRGSRFAVTAERMVDGRRVIDLEYQGV